MHLIYRHINDSHTQVNKTKTTTRQSFPLYWLMWLNERRCVANNNDTTQLRPNIDQTRNWSQTWICVSAKFIVMRSLADVSALVAPFFIVCRSIVSDASFLHKMFDEPELDSVCATNFIVFFPKELRDHFPRCVYVSTWPPFESHSGVSACANCTYYYRPAITGKDFNSIYYSFPSFKWSVSYRCGFWIPHFAIRHCMAS